MGPPGPLLVELDDAQQGLRVFRSDFCGNGGGYGGGDARVEVDRVTAPRCHVSD